MLEGEKNSLQMCECADFCVAIVSMQTDGPSVCDSQRACIHAAVRTHASVSKLSLTPAAALGKLL